MRAYPTICAILLSTAFGATTAAQSLNQVPKSPDQPAGQIPSSIATATLIDLKLNPDEVINIKRLPSVAELAAVARAHGLVIEKIVLTNAQITAVYKDQSNQFHTVCYQFPQEISSQPASAMATVAAVAPALAVTPTFVSPAPIAAEAVPADDYAAYGEPIYYSGYSPYPWFGSIPAYSRAGLHAYRGYHVGSYRSATYHGGSYRSATCRSTSSSGGGGRSSGRW